MTIREMHMRLSDGGNKAIITIVFAGLKSGLLEYHSETTDEVGPDEIASACDNLVTAGYTYYGITPP